MELTPDDVLFFAGNLLERVASGFGQNWTQREIDGFFFNEFLNPDLKDIIENLRRRLLGREVKPFSARYKMVHANLVGLKPPPAPDYPYRTHVRSLLFKGNDALPKPELIIDYVSRRFTILPRDLRLAILSGEPIPFQSIIVSQGITNSDAQSPRSFDSQDSLQQAPFCCVKIYCNVIAPEGWDFIKSTYEDLFLGTTVRFLQDQGAVDGSGWSEEIGTNLEAELIHGHVPLLQVRSYPPFASALELENLTRRALGQYRSMLPGKSAGLQAIRAWAVYLLNEGCGLSNRQAIRLWNENLGAEHSIVYTMSEMETELQGSSVSQAGEAHFSKDKRALELRIATYRSILAAPSTDED